MNMKKLTAVILTMAMMLTAAAGLAEAPADGNTGDAQTPAAAETQDAAAIAQTDAGVGTQAAAADVQKLDAAYTLALNAINKEDYATARKYLNIAFVYCDKETNPEVYSDLLLKQACLDVIEEQPDIALLALDAALKISPDLADAYLVRTQIYTAQSDLANAIENLEKYIELTGQTEMFETVAQLQEAGGNMEAAQAAYDKYVAAAGADNQEAGFQAALYRMENGKYADAIEAFTAYAEDKTYGAGAQYNIGVCKMNMEDYAGAIEAFNACESKGGEFSGLYYNRGICSLMSTDWAKGAEDFEKSIKSEPYVNDARYNLGVCRMQQGEYEAAAAAFDQLEKDFTAEEGLTLNDAVYYFRAICNAALGKLEDAIRDYTTCIEHGYELAQSYYERSQVYAAMGDTEKQSEDLENSLKYAK